MVCFTPSEASDKIISGVIHLSMIPYNMTPPYRKESMKPNRYTEVPLVLLSISLPRNCSPDGMMVMPFKGITETSKFGCDS